MAPGPLEVAVRAAVAGDLRLLKEMGSTMDLRLAVNTSGWSILHLAAAKGALDLCRFLVEEYGFDANSVSEDGETPIFAAIKAKVHDGGAAIISVLRYLIQRGGDPAKPDAKGCTPLHKAADFGHDKVVSLLLSKGVPVDPLCNRGTPLLLAAFRRNDQALKILLEHGADPNRVVQHAFSPLLMAYFGHSFKCLKLLVEAGADVNFIGPFGRTVLYDAVDGGLRFTDFVKFLLEAGADPNIHDAYGRFPIMLAAARKQRELVEILLPWAKPIPSVQDWSADGIIRAKKYLLSEPRELLEQEIADAKSHGKEAFARGDYVAAVYYYAVAQQIDPNDATLFSNLSLCSLRNGNGKQALAEARKCKALRPDWPKAWYREGTAHVLLKNYKEAVDAFHEAQKLDPASYEIKKALIEAAAKELNSLLDGEDSEEEDP